MSWLRKLALAAVATLVALLLVEGAARWLGIDPGYGSIRRLGDAPTRTVNGVVLWQYYEPRTTEADLARAAGARDALKVVGLGDSIMYGVGQAEADTYLDAARRHLAERSARPVEILNLAVPGYNTLQEDAVHQEIAARLRPDVVLLHYWSDDERMYRVAGGYVLDFGDMSPDGRLVVRAVPLPAPLNDFLLVHSVAYQLLTQAVVAWDRRAAPGDWSRVTGPLLALNERVRKDGGRLVVLVSPPLDGDTVRPNGDLPALRRLGAEHGFEVIDLSQWLDGADAAAVRMDGCHLNAEGHRRIGQHLADYLLAHDLAGSAR